jgi:hypothetical protein
MSNVVRKETLSAALLKSRGWHTVAQRLHNGEKLVPLFKSMRHRGVALQRCAYRGSRQLPQLLWVGT